MNIGNIGIGSLFGGLDQAELQRRIAQYQSGIGGVAPPTTTPTKAVAPRPTPVALASKPAPVVTPKPAPVTPKPAVTDNRVAGTGVDYGAPKSAAATTPVTTATATTPVTTATATTPVTTATTDSVTAKLSSADPAIAAQAAEDLRSMYRGLGIDPKNLGDVISPEVAAALEEPTDAKYTMGKYKDFLMSGTSRNFYGVIDDVDELDDFYDKGYAGKVLGGITKPIEATFTPEEYVDQTGSPEYLKGFKTAANIEDTRNAYGSIAEIDGVEDTSAVLSDHYGYDFNSVEEKVTADNFGGNFETHSNATSEEISEFQSLVKPILREQIPYLQATEGLSYQDALMEAYKRDPMLQSLYAKYDVTPVRQTKDGSTYLYDPMSFAEIRTKEVKYSSVKDALKMAAIIAASFYGGSFLANAFAGTAGTAGAAGAAGAGAGAGAWAGDGAGAACATAGAAGATAAGAGAGIGATIAGNATASALITAATGGDMNDILKAAATAGLTSGVGAYAEGLNASAAQLGEAAKQAEGLALAGTFSVEHADLLTNASDATKAFEAATKTAESFSNLVKNGTFITKAVSGDVAGAVIGRYGDKFTTAALDKVGLNEKFLEGFNINQDDLTSGLVKTQMELAKGTDFDNALVRGLGEYIKEGGALAPNNMKTPEFIKRIGDAIRYTGKMFDDTIFEPVKDATQPVIDAAKAVGKKVDDKVFEPVKETVEAAGKKIDDKVIEPVKETVEAAGKKIDDKVIEPVKETVEAAGSAVDDAVIQPVREALKDVDKPDVDIDTPDVDIDTPNLGLSLSDILALISGGGGGGGGGGTPGITTEKAPPLFKLGEQEERQDDIAAFLASLTGNNSVVNAASGGMIQSSYRDLFDTIHQPKQTSDSTLNELLRVVGSKR